MIVLAYDNDAQRADFVRPGGKSILVSDERALETAVLISLFTDRRADDADVSEGSDARGWWGDSYAEVDGDQIGSRLWLLARSGKDILRRAELYAAEALAWMLEDGVASSVKTTAEAIGSGILLLTIAITRPDRLGPWLRTWKVPHAL